MVRRIVPCFFTFFFLSWAVFLTMSLFLETSGPARRAESLLDLDSVLNFITEKTKNEITVINNSLKVIKTIGSATVSETKYLSKYITLQNGKIDMKTACEEAEALIRYSKTYDVPLDLAVAVANTESHFNPGALSSHGSAGVMQVTWKFHRDILTQNGIKNSEELFDRSLGIKAGCVVIAHYMKTEKDLKTALGRYYGGSPQVYWRRISRNLEKFRSYNRKRLGSISPKKPL